MSWLSRLKSRIKRPSSVQRPQTFSHRPTLEHLESRIVLSYWPTRLKIVPGGFQTPPAPYHPLGVVKDSASNQQFVAGLYHDLLGREPSLGEVSGWVNSLQNSAPRGLVLEMFLGGTEYRSNQIQSAYNTLLGRPADDAARSFWLGQMQAGAGYKTMLGVLLGSNEFYAKQKNNDTLLIYGLYRNLLHRFPEPAALSTWVGALRNGTASRTNVVATLLNSAEASGQFVDEIYHDLLGRAPDSLALSTWAPAIQAGMPTDVVRLYVAGSTEYSDLQQGTSWPIAGLDQTSTPHPFVQTPVVTVPPGGRPDLVLRNGGNLTATVGSTVDINRQSGNQSEVAIGINPTNTNQMFAFANDNSGAGGMSAAFSTDGGVTWTSRFLGNGSDGIPSGFSDPWIAWDSFGNLFISYLGFASNGSDLQMPINVSTDGGQTFQNVGLFPVADHPEINVGPGLVAVTVNNNNNQISVFMAQVTGLGQVGTFQEFTAPNSDGGNFGDIAVGPNGQVAAVWQQGGSSVGPDQISITTDPDGLGGQPLTNPTVVTDTNVGSFRPIAAQPSRTVLANASLAWDLSNGAHRGRLYMSYCDAANTTTDDLNVFLRFSDDGGVTWSGATRVNDDTTDRSQFFPRVAVDNSTGNVAIAWYDCRLDPGSGAFDTDGVPNTDVVAFGTLSSDGGATWSTNFQIAAGPSNSLRVPGGNSGNEFGDYNGIAFANGRLFYAWTDNSPDLIGNNDKPNFDIATALVLVGSGGGGGGGGGGGAGLAADIYELNDTSDRATFFGVYAGDTTVKSLSIAAHASLLPDYDWYSFVAGAAGTFTATIAYVPSGAGDLNMRIFTVDANNTLIQLGASLNLRTTFQQVSIVGVPVGMRVFVWVYGFNFAQASYEMNLKM
jgi:hypothetical protein